MNLLIIGTSHIAQESVHEIQVAFQSFQPAIVALELDRGRFHSLFAKTRNISWRDVRAVGIKGFVFAVLGSWIQRRLGKMVQTEPGIEMKTAAMLAQQYHTQIALIDQPLEMTLRRLSALTWREKLRLAYDLSIGLALPQKELRLVSFDLRTVPAKAQIKKMIALFKKRYPSLYRVLVTERNVYMTQKIKAIQGAHPGEKVLVIVGAGHEEGLRRMLAR